MLTGVERCVDLVGCRASGLGRVSLPDLERAVFARDARRLGDADGHFAALARDGNVVRLARTIGIPLRYFVAKMYHGPFLVVSDRVDRLFDWCRENKIAWQFDPMYTRMVPAHHLVEIEQIGCPDPSPRYTRFFDPRIAEGPADVDELGARYVRAAYDALARWIAAVPADEPIALAFSGGVDSTSVLLLARKVLSDAGGNPDRIRAFTLDLGDGVDARQAEDAVRSLGLEASWERVVAKPEDVDFDDAIATIEDYHPLDVECAAVALCLLRAIRERYPSMRFLLDGDGGDENLKSYPLEDSDLTISSVLKNPLLYQEGWGVDALKHSQTYSGGLSRSYVRTFAPSACLGFDAFSPYTVPPVIAEAAAIPFETLAAGSVERLYALKSEVVAAGVRSVAGIDMPVNAKRRFQDGAIGESVKRWKLDKASCRRTFLRQWEERLEVAWREERISGNDVTLPPPTRS